MNEKQLQYKLVVWFSQNYPELHGRLFEINNDAYNIKHHSKRVGMGLIAGVSDLIFITNDGKIAGIELKAPGSRHSKDHIKNQLEWGRTVLNLNGYYLMSCDLDECKAFISAFISNKEGTAIAIQSIALKKINSLLIQNNNETIKF